MLRIAGIEEESFVDGIGIRYTIFTQGCAHNCRGCHNPSTHAFDGGYMVSIGDFVAKIMENKLISGVTISGGDPLYQIDGIIELCRLLKLQNVNIWCYTGFIYEEKLNDAKFNTLLRYIDVLVDGPYMDIERDLTLRFRGSRNQRIIDIKESLRQKKVVELMLD